MPATRPVTLHASRLAAAVRRPRARRAMLVAAVIGMLVLAAWGAMHAIHPDALTRAFASVSWPWVAASGIAYALGQVASGLMWGVGLSAGGLGAGELLPAQLGQVVRYAAIRRHPAAGEGSCLRIAGSVGAWKVVDGLVTFVVVAIATMVMPLPEAASGLRWLALGTLVGLLLALVGVWRLGPARVARRLPRRLQGPVRGLGQGAAVLTRRREALAAIGLQLVAISGRVVSLAALLHAFGMPAEAALLVFALLVLSGVLAISPGGVGVREAALVPALVATYGLGTELTLAFSLGIQATALAVSLLGAAVALVHQRLWPPRSARVQA